MASPRSIMPSNRQALLARLHCLAKETGLDEDAYRDLLERETGRRSAAALGEADIARVIQVLGAANKGGVAVANGPFVHKLKALWISAWHLGLLRDNSDQAMIAFLKRQTGLASPRFLIHPPDAVRAIEGLKAWMERQRGVRWWQYPTLPRRAVAEAQVRRLYELGDIANFGSDHANTEFLENYACRVTGKARGLGCFSIEDWDRTIAALGARLRKAERRHSEGELKHEAG